MKFLIHKDGNDKIVFIFPNDFEVSNKTLNQLYQTIPYRDGDVNVVQFISRWIGNNSCTRFYSLNEGLIHSTTREAYNSFVDGGSSSIEFYLEDIRFSKDLWEFQVKNEANNY